MKLGKEIKETPEKRQCTKTKEKVSTHFGKRVKEDLKGELKKEEEERQNRIETGRSRHWLAGPRPCPAQPSPAPESSSSTSRYSETFIWCDMLVLWEG